MEVKDKNLGYFEKFMPDEKYRDDSYHPTQIADYQPIFQKTSLIIDFLNNNYSTLADNKMIYHMFERTRNYSKELCFLGLEIRLDNRKKELRGIIRLYHRNCDDMFYYTFQTIVDEIRIRNDGKTNNEWGKIFERELCKILEEVELEKLAHSRNSEPTLYCTFNDLDIESFENFYKKLTDFSDKVSLLFPWHAA